MTFRALGRIQDNLPVLKALMKSHLPSSVCRIRVAFSGFGHEDVGPSGGRFDYHKSQGLSLSLGALPTSGRTATARRPPGAPYPLYPCQNEPLASPVIRRCSPRIRYVPALFGAQR